MKNAVLIIGGAGGIASALIDAWQEDDSVAGIYVVSRSKQPEEFFSSNVYWHCSDYSDSSIAATVSNLKIQLKVHGEQLAYVCICNGILHGSDFQPEKRLETFAETAAARVMHANAIVPLLWLKHLTALLAKGRDSASTVCTLAVFSARVGSISDNRLGGWYSYRMSKAALNMGMKTAAIEYARRAKSVKLLAFHPGTTDTKLSKPFQSKVPPEKLFAPAFVAKRLIGLMKSAEADGELSYLDWQGKPINW